MYTVGATQLWFRVRVPFVDFLLNIQRNSSSITKDHSANPQTPPTYTSAIRQFFSAKIHKQNL
jgi:hypothetical protein